jgi:DinB superfamily
MKNGSDKSLRDQLIQLLNSGHAHASFDDAVEGFPPELRGKKVKDLPYSAWMLLEHMRLAQWDILEFSRSAKHQSPKFPEGYWPATADPPQESSWDESIKSFRADLKAMQKLVSDPKTDLNKPFPWGDGQNVLREALLIADHNAYHLGEFIVLRRLLGAWKK